MDFSPEKLAVYAVLSFGSAILSGIAGGGAGFINTPLLIFLGLPPGQAVATGKLNGLAVSVSSLHGMREVKIPQGAKRTLVISLGLALLIALAAPFAIRNLNPAVYQRLMGVLLLGMVPVVLLKKQPKAAASAHGVRQWFGYGLLAVAFGLQAVFSGGLGTLVNVALMAGLGLPALQATVIKRYSQIILNGVIVCGVLFSGLISWQIALVAMLTGSAGAAIGSRLAVKKGNQFVTRVLVLLMIGSAIALLVK